MPPQPRGRLRGTAGTAANKRSGCGNGEKSAGSIATCITALTDPAAVAAGAVAAA